MKREMIKPPVSLSRPTRVEIRLTERKNIRAEIKQTRLIQHVCLNRDPIPAQPDAGGRRVHPIHVIHPHALPMPITRRIIRLRNGQQHQAVARGRVGDRRRDPTPVRPIINHPGIEHIRAAQAPPKTIQRDRTDHPSAAILDPHLAPQRHHQMIRPHRTLSIRIERHRVIQQRHETCRHRRRGRGARSRQHHLRRRRDRQAAPRRICNHRTTRDPVRLPRAHRPAPALHLCGLHETRARLACRQLRHIHQLTIQRPPLLARSPGSRCPLRRHAASGAQQPRRRQHRTKRNLQNTHSIHKTKLHSPHKTFIHSTRTR